MALLLAAYWYADDREIPLPLKMYSVKKQEERTAMIVNQLEESVADGMLALGQSVRVQIDELSTSPEEAHDREE